MAAQDMNANDSVDDMRAFLKDMPKAELHLHREGALRAETMVEMARRNGIDYFTTVEDVKQSLADRPPGLMGFLEHHFKSQNIMKNGQDFYDTTYKLMENIDFGTFCY